MTSSDSLCLDDYFSVAVCPFAFDICQKAGLYVHSFGFLQQVLHWHILLASVKSWEVLLSLPSTYPSPFNKSTIRHDPYCLYTWHLSLDWNVSTWCMRAVGWLMVIGLAMYGLRLDVQPDSTVNTWLSGVLCKGFRRFDKLPRRVWDSGRSIAGWPKQITSI